MYEELYKPLPNSSKYLERMAFSGTIDHTQETLSKLIYAHHTSVPFENYDICEMGRPISLDISKLYEKIVLNRRGGYCFELNGIFASLLISLGFKVWPVLAMVCRATFGEQPMPPTHRINLVCLEGRKMFTDVGFGGPMPAGALVLEENTRQEVMGSVYHFEKRPNQRWTLFRETSDKTIQPLINFAEMPAEPVDFVTPNFYTSTHPDAFFVKNRMANIRFNNGFAAINNGQFQLVLGSDDTTSPIESKEQELALLEEYFGIHLK
jgi:N-hydroxyarylamine O-acetyltransferase